MTIGERAVASGATDQAWLEKLGQAVGQSSVRQLQPDDPLAKVSTTEPAGRCRIVVSPTDREMLPGILEIARTHHLTIYPISRGRNWGYGSATPTADCDILLDLSSLNQIRFINKELGLVSIEPGVSQQDLYDFLQRQSSPYMVPTSGAGPLASVLGNALERGYGITPIADHFHALTHLKAYLPDGTLYESPLKGIGAGIAADAFKWGIGPYLDGLFTQSNLGIVVEGTIQLAPRPAQVAGFFFSLRDEQQLEPAVNAVRTILHELAGQVGSINLMNARRVMAMTAPYPFDQLGADGVIDDEALRKMCKDYQVMPWMGAGAIYSTGELARGIRKVIRKHLGPYCRRLVFMNEGGARKLKHITSRLPRWLVGRIPQALETVEQALVNFSGQPSEVALPLVYWKQGGCEDKPRPLDPARDNCGLTWYSPLVPTLPGKVRAYVEQVEKVCRQHAIEPLITLTSVSPNCFDSTVPLLFDRQNEVEVRQAHDCYRALLNEGKALGLVPYRLPTHAMADLQSEHPQAWALAGRMKQAIDPQGLLAPGRYIPPQQ